MIGFYDYTVILTYASLVSAVVGVFVSLCGGIPHPYIAIFLLLFSGLCDAFDGRVARSKKNRTKSMCNFGIQIDSLCDLVAFGVLPACIGYAMWLIPGGFKIPAPVMVAVSCLYVLGGVIRLAYFNVTEDELQASGKTKREFYSGLPITSASLIFPTFALVNWLMWKYLQVNISWRYHVLMLVVAFAFVGKFKLRKPGNKALMVMMGIGLLEAVILLLSKYVF